MSFLSSLAVLTLSALLLGSIFRHLRLPPLTGMLLIGIVTGPYALNLLAPELLSISADLRQFALIVILTRAGLSLNLSDLRRVGHPALLLCFVPASCEIVGYVLLAPPVLGLSAAEGSVIGAVMAAVSPAVVVPRMLRLQEEGYGTARGIPQMITAGASCDDVFVIVLFTAFLSMTESGGFDFSVLYRIPVSLLSGIAVGVCLGWLFSRFFRRFPVRDTGKMLIFLSVAFLLVALENRISSVVPFSGLLGVISLGVSFRRQEPERAGRLSVRFGKVWVAAEILLFVLVGAEVDISYAWTSGGRMLAVMFPALLLRMGGVCLCLLGTALTARERLFCAIAYLPKATVQAAIGGLALAAGLACGQAVLTCAVLAILITAPLGAFLTDVTYKKLLNRDL